jgi:D-xylose transport system substrate-binding protein
MSARNVLMLASLCISVAIGLLLARGNSANTGASGGLRGAAGSDAQRAPVIGVSMDTLKEARWQIDRDVISARCKELGATAQVHAANSDDLQQMRDVESLLTSGVDALIIIPHDAVAMAKGVELGKRARVPVISYDRIVRDCEPDLYVGFDNETVGELQAKFLIDHLPTPGRGRIVRVYGAKTDNNSMQFKAGQDRALAPYITRGDIKVVHEDWAEDWKPENAKRIVNAAITNNGRTIDAVLASNDGTAGGAIQALTEEGLAGKVLVTGQDAELAACQRIVAGTQTMTVFKPLKELATNAADAAVAMARGKPIVARFATNNGKLDVPTLLTPVVALTKDNMVDVVVRSGFLPYDEVYRGVPESQRPPRP